MANVTVVLKPFNNVALATGNAYNLVAPGSGHYYFSILNLGTGDVAISNANTVSATDPGSYLLPPNLSLSPLAWGTTGVWVAAAAAESISVALLPRDQ